MGNARMRTCLAAMALVALLGPGVPSTFGAQADTASISGSVTDPTGAVVPDAVVRLIDIDRDVAITTTTGNSGRYAFAATRPGRYHIEVAKSGFNLVRLERITVNVLDNLQQNFTLQLGPVIAAVAVEAAAVNVNSSYGTVSTVIDRH